MALGAGMEYIMENTGNAVVDVIVGIANDDMNQTQRERALDRLAGKNCPPAKRAMLSRELGNLGQTKCKRTGSAMSPRDALLFVSGSGSPFAGLVRIRGSWRFYKPEHCSNRFHGLDLRSTDGRTTTTFTEHRPHRELPDDDVPYWDTLSGFVCANPNNHLKPGTCVRYWTLGKHPGVPGSRPFSLICLDSVIQTETKPETPKRKPTTPKRKPTTPKRKPKTNNG